jgi:hypothetical protein
MEEKTLGPTHPTVAKTLADLAEAESFMNMLDDAEKHVARAKDIFIAAYGPEHVLVGQTLVSAANIAARRGKSDEAIAMYTQAAALLAGKLPPDPPRARARDPRSPYARRGRARRAADLARGVPVAGRPRRRSLRGRHEVTC